MSDRDTSLQDFSSDSKYMRRRPFRETNIADISSPGKYRIIGTITEIQGDTFIITDGTTEIDGTIVNAPDFEIKEGSVLRIFGFVEFEPKKQLKASIIQNLSGVDVETYTQIKELEKSLMK